MSYEELVKSNWGFIPLEIQKKIQNIRILLAGCGLGSNIAVLAARTGFTRFVVADGDTVALGNLNRQSFRREHLGQNKAIATAELIREINPDCEIEVFPHFISTTETVKNLTEKADIIINMVDHSPVLYSINETARNQKKPVLFPMNIVFGGAVLVFTGDSSTIDDMLPERDQVKNEAFFLNLVETMIPYLPEYVLEYMSIKDTIIQNGNLSIPQLGIAANLTAAQIITVMVSLINGEEIPVAPKPIMLDCRSALAGTPQRFAVTPTENV